MRRIAYAPLCALALLALGTQAARASVQVRVGVRPDTLAHCDPGSFSFALWNDGPDSLRVRLFLLLEHDSLSFGHPLRVRLGSHDLRHREVGFVVPPGLPSGSYTLRLKAVASDSSRAEDSATFVVLPGGCGDGGDPAPQVALIESVAAGMGFDTATPTLHESWGGVKRRYDARIH